SDWSSPAQWTMGLLDPIDWQGKWIGRDEKGIVKDAGSPYAALEGARWIWDADKANAGAPAGGRFFRAGFTLPPGRAIASATLIAGADSQADVYCNAALVASGSNATLPAVSDVAALMHPGE